MRRNLWFGFILWVGFNPLGMAAKRKSNTAKLHAYVSKYDVYFEQSIQVNRIADQQTLYAHNPDSLLSPASLTKIATSAAVLVGFPPEHQFETAVYYTGSFRKGVVNGDLIVRGDGDPYLVSEKVWQLAVDLKNMGLKRVQGNLVLDSSLFGGETRDKSREEGRKISANAYDAPITALGVNFNTVELAISSAEKVGERPRVAISPYALSHVLVENNMRTTQANSRSRISVQRISRDSQNMKIKATGKVPLDSALKKVYRSVSDPVVTTGEMLKAFLKKEGIEVAGLVSKGEVSSKAHLLHSQKGFPIGYALKGLNTYSNNFVADVLLKRLGAEHPKNGTPLAKGSGTLANGISYMHQLLTKTVGLEKGFKVFNGSGLSEHNLFSSAQVSKILLFMAKRLELFPEFIASLPISGVSGSLEKRFRRNDTSFLVGKVRAKTGTLTQPKLAIGLAGYFEHPKHGLCSFSIIHNGKPSHRSLSVGDTRHYQDRLVSKFYQYL